MTTTALCQNQPWEGSILMATDDAIYVGTIETIKKLHPVKISLNKKMGRRIAYHEDTQSIILGTSQMIKNPDSGVERYKGWIQLYDAHTFKGKLIYIIV